MAEVLSMTSVGLHLLYLRIRGYLFVSVRGISLTAWGGASPNERCITNTILGIDLRERGAPAIVNLRV
jgi:hypothetical protein